MLFSVVLCLGAALALPISAYTSNPIIDRRNDLNEVFVRALEEELFARGGHNPNNSPYIPAKHRPLPAIPARPRPLPATPARPRPLPVAPALRPPRHPVNPPVIPHSPVHAPVIPPVIPHSPVHAPVIPPHIPHSPVHAPVIPPVIPPSPGMSSAPQLHHPKPVKAAGVERPKWLDHYRRRELLIRALEDELMRRVVNQPIERDYDENLWARGYDDLWTRMEVDELD